MRACVMQVGGALHNGHWTEAQTQELMRRMEQDNVRDDPLSVPA